MIENCVINRSVLNPFDGPIYYVHMLRFWHKICNV